MTINVVTNSGPLMVFSKLNLLHLFKHLYGKVYFPIAVYEETVIEGIQHGFEDAHILHLFLRQNQWEPTSIYRGKIPASILSTNLDRGEQEAIALALSKKGMILMDEESGRSIAREQGLIVKGSLGVLIEAYRRNFINIEQIRFYFAQISERTDIWISPNLCHRLLEQINA